MFAPAKVAPVGLLLVLVLIGAWAVLKHNQRRAAALEAELHQLRSRVEELDSQRQASVAQAWLQQANQAAVAIDEDGARRAATSSSSEAAAPAAQPPADLPAMRAAALERRRERAEKLSRAFSADGMDREWSVQTVRAIQATVAATGGGRLLQAKCASHLCRVLVEHGSLNEQTEFAQEIWKSPPFDQGVFFDYDKASNPPKTTLYVAREGTELASLGR